ncbi:hypothetical protein JCM19237_1100 [Photobacterium aphoticum]|uniref:Uncharacterized protein n=1 Tax=Photobacterium aphoticum TaxID=754436 RepID=A0A090QQA1_9GAMM|nr:hypothetical protein JCM19237_1100 [Photobacterium aphoticum]
MQLYNQFEYEQAKAVFQAEVDKGNAHALYWLGVTQYATGGTYEPGQNFLKAAKWEIHGQWISLCLMIIPVVVKWQAGLVMKNGQRKP